MVVAPKTIKLKCVFSKSGSLPNWADNLLMFHTFRGNPVVQRVWLQSPALSQNTCATSATSISLATLRHTSFAQANLPLCALHNSLPFQGLNQSWEIRPCSKGKEILNTNFRGGKIWGGPSVSKVKTAAESRYQITGCKSFSACKDTNKFLQAHKKGWRAV